MPRKRLYHTPEEQKEANRLKSSRYYHRNKDRIKQNRMKTRTMQRSTSPPMTTSPSRSRMSTRGLFQTYRKYSSPLPYPEATDLPKANANFQLDSTPRYIETRLSLPVMDEHLESEDMTMEWDQEGIKNAMTEEKKGILALKQEPTKATGKLAKENARIMRLEQIIEVLSGSNDLLKLEVDSLKLLLQESWKKNVSLRAGAGAQKKESSDAEYQATYNLVRKFDEDLAEIQARFRTH